MPTVLKTIFLLLCNHIYSFTVVRSIANSFPSHIPARYSYARCLSSFLKRPKKYFLLYTLLLLYSYRADLICCWTVNITLIFKKRDTGISVIFLHRYRRTFERYQKRAVFSSDIYMFILKNHWMMEKEGMFSKNCTSISAWNGLCCKKCILWRMGKRFEYFSVLSSLSSLRVFVVYKLTRCFDELPFIHVFLL